MEKVSSTTSRCSLDSRSRGGTQLPFQLFLRFHLTDILLFIFRLRSFIETHCIQLFTPHCVEGTIAGNAQYPGRW